MSGESFTSHSWMENLPLIGANVFQKEFTKRKDIFEQNSNDYLLLLSSFEVLSVISIIFQIPLTLQ